MWARPYPPSMTTIAQPRIRFFTGPSGQRIAYAVAGQGPPVVLSSWWVSHVERDGADDRFRRFFERLAASNTVVRFDRPGVGLSAREQSDWSLESETAQLAALIDELGFERTALLGFSCGGPAAITYAARNPERVSRLVLVNAYACGESLAKPELRKALIDMTRASWGLGARTLSTLFAPDLDKDESEQLAAYQRACCSSEVAARLLEMTFALDCRESAPKVKAPALVLHRRKDGTVRVDEGRALAALLPDADLRIVDGDAHMPWQGDQAPIVDAVLDFLEVDDGTESAVAALPDDTNLWRREGDLWRLRFAGREAMLAHRKGLEDLALLISQPMREVSAVELRGGGDEAEAGSGGGADDALDEKARAQYAARLREIDAELAEAEARHDAAASERVEAEREALIDELRRATGLGGRSRRIGDPGERARKAVSARIRDAIARVREAHPELADHLDASVSTGLTCVYRPDAARFWLV